MRTEPSSLHVHILDRPADPVLKAFRAALPENVQLTTGPIQTDTPSFEILVSGYPTPSVLAHSASLKHLIIPWAGLPEVTREVLRGHPTLALHNIHHNADAVAEMAIALLLSASRHLFSFERAFRQNDWGERTKKHNQARLLKGQKALVLGYGHIGKRIAQLLHSLGLKVSATRRQDAAQSPTLHQGVAVYPASALHTLLPTAEVLLLSLPLTQETRGIIGKKELTLLPKSAILVNIGRAYTVDEEALFESLVSGHLYAAGLDVWYNYPKSQEERDNTPPSKYPFHTLENVVMSPHRADNCEQNEFLRMAEVARLLAYAARGESMPNQISLQRGY